MNNHLPEVEPANCRFCGQKTVNTGTQLCDRCWELQFRIEADTVLAEKILKDVKTKKYGKVVKVKTYRKPLKQRREADQLRRQQERYYADARQAQLCSCGRQGIGLSIYKTPVCHEHNSFPTKRVWYFPPIPDWDAKTNPIFDKDAWLAKVPYYNFEPKPEQLKTNS